MSGSTTPRLWAAMSEVFCPKHMTQLVTAGSASAMPAADYCPSCGVSWELAVTAGTIPTTSLLIPRFAVTDGSVVLVARTL